MQPFPHVVNQVILLLVTTAFVVACTGDSVAPGLVIITGVGAGVTALFAIGYYVRRRVRCTRGEVSSTRLRDDRRMAVLAVAGYGVPVAISGAMVAGVRVTGLAFHSETATIASCLPVAALVALLTASAVDWYLIVPFQRGVLNTPICRQDADAPDVSTRRQYARWWVLRQAMSDVIAYMSVLLLVVLIGGVLVDRFKAATPLQFALSSFIGAATAVWLGAYFSRIVGAWQFVNEQSVGLGRWVQGVDIRAAPIQGFVRDVSITPGIQICSTPFRSAFVPLKRIATAVDLDIPAPLCTNRCDHWIELCDEHFREQDRDQRAAREVISTFLEAMRASAWPGTVLMRAQKGVRLRRGWILSDGSGSDPSGPATSTGVFLDDAGRLWSWTVASATGDEPYVGTLDRPLVAFKLRASATGRGSAFADLPMLERVLGDLRLRNRAG